MLVAFCLEQAWRRRAFGDDGNRLMRWWLSTARPLASTNLSINRCVLIGHITISIARQLLQCPQENVNYGAYGSDALWKEKEKDVCAYREHSVRWKSKITVFLRWNKLLTDVFVIMGDRWRCVFLIWCRTSKDGEKNGKCRFEEGWNDLRLGDLRLKPDHLWSWIYKRKLNRLA